MMKRAKLHALLVAVAILPACEPGGVANTVSPAQFELDSLRWKEQRLANLKGPDGYLNLVGLYWLQEGLTTIGSAADNDIVLPAAAAGHVGTLRVSGDGVSMQVNDGIAVFSAQQPIRSIFIADDTTDAPVTITHAALAWTIIRRDHRFALRLRDFESPTIAAFPPIEYFPLDPNMVVAATLRRFPEPKVLEVDTVIEGLGWRPESPGIVEFEMQGQKLSLEAYESGDELFFVFGDLSNGEDTYPAGRFLYADVPLQGDVTTLDFNRAYNPPCAFNDFATCPIASVQNRLPLRIEAGEKFDPLVHSTPAQFH